MTESRKLAAILAADMVGYSRLAGVDEELILARLRTLRSDLIDPTIAVHGGRVVKRTGDGLLVEFRSVVDAVRCSIEIQLGVGERNAGLPQDKRIEYRVGIHIGDVVEESDGDLMGDGVNIAARLEGIAKPGAICLSEQAYWQVKGRLDLGVKDLGPTRLKNIAEPVHVYSLEAGVPARAKPLKGARGWRHKLAVLAALIVALAAIAAGVWRFQSTGRIEATAERTAIMVLPFANLSGDSSQNPLAEAVTDGLTDSLSRLVAAYPFAHVIAADTAKTYAGRPIDVKQIGKDLGLRYVLRGSVQSAEARVRVSAQLIDAESGVQLWAETFDEDRADALEMEDEIVARISNALRIRLAELGAESGNGLPRSQALAFLCAARLGNSAPEAVDPAKRTEILEACDEALRLDPHNALALGVRAVGLLNGVERGQSADREGDLRRAKEDIATLLAVNANELVRPRPQRLPSQVGGTAGTGGRRGRAKRRPEPGFRRDLLPPLLGLHRRRTTGEGHRLRRQGGPFEPTRPEPLRTADDKSWRAGDARTQRGGVGLGGPQSRPVAGESDRAAQSRCVVVGWRGPGSKRRPRGRS